MSEKDYYKGRLAVDIDLEQTRLETMVTFEPSLIVVTKEQYEKLYKIASSPETPEEFVKRKGFDS